MKPPHENAPEVSVVIPYLDEEENLPILFAELRAALDPSGLAYELLFVDDGSTDGGPAWVAGLAAADPRVRLLRHRRNAGLSAGLATGFRHARGAVVVSLDADLQNDPADIPRLLAELASCDVVCGVRARRRDSWLRRAASRVANGVRNRLTRESIADVGCTLRAYRAEFVRALPLFSGMHRFLPTLLRLEGARVREVPVNHRPRLHGRAKYNIRNRIWKATVDLFAVRWMQTRWIERDLATEVFEEDLAWTRETSGSPSASPDRRSFPPASSSSGSPPSAGSAASSPAPSGSSRSPAG